MRSFWSTTQVIDCRLQGDRRPPTPSRPGTCRPGTPRTGINDLVDLPVPGVTCRYARSTESEPPGRPPPGSHVA